MRHSLGNSLQPGRIASLALTVMMFTFTLFATSQTPGNPPAPPSSTPNVQVSSGDLLVVDVFNTPELSGKFRVDQTGMINLPQGGALNVTGLSAGQTGEAIERRLRDAQIMLDPHVSVFVQEYATQGVIVLGEVKNPGTYTLLGEHSVYGALAAAGGTTANEGSTITVSHQGSSAEQVLELGSPSFPLAQRSTRVNPGDTVLVSRASTIYVIGDVGHPGGYQLPSGEPLKVLSAVALAQGLNRTAKSSKATIIRDTPDGPRTIPLDIDKIRKNEMPDPVLEASDILVVPRNETKAFLQVAIPAVAVAAVAATVYSVVNR